METRHVLRKKRKARVRQKVSGTSIRPRLSIFKSNRLLLAQVIDDEKGITLVSAREPGKNLNAGNHLGETLANLLKTKKIKTVVFDRNGYRFHGVVKTIADAIVKGGIKI